MFNSGHSQILLQSGLRIDLELDDTEHCFPLTAHVAYGNKIARGVIAQNIWEKGEVEVRTTQLSYAEAHDLDMHFTAVHDQAADNAFDEAIREADSALEDLI